MKYFIILLALITIQSRDGFLHSSPIGADWLFSLYTWPKFHWDPDIGVTVAIKDDYYLWCLFSCEGPKMLRCYMDNIYAYASKVEEFERWYRARRLYQPEADNFTMAHI